MEIEEVLSVMGLLIACALEELSCKSNSLDPYGFIWDNSDNCALSIFQTEDVNMVKQDKKNYVVSGRDFVQICS